MNNNKLFIKIYYNIDDKTKDANISKHLIGGGFYNKEGGHLTFKAKNLEEAKSMANDIYSKTKFENLNFLLLPDNVIKLNN